jgi:hypothetical protein
MAEFFDSSSVLLIVSRGKYRLSSNRNLQGPGSGSQIASPPKQQVKSRPE